MISKRVLLQVVGVLALFGAPSAAFGVALLRRLGAIAASEPLSCGIFSGGVGIGSSSTVSPWSLVYSWDSVNERG